MRRFVLGDVHGGFLALVDAFKEAKFDYENDLLIFLGDVADGWSQTKECIDELMKIKNLIHCLGNHDEWAMMYYDGTMKPDVARFSSISHFQSWYQQGGEKTVESLGDFDNQDPKYLEWFRAAKLCHIIEEDGKKKIFAHANIPHVVYDMDVLIEKGSSYDFVWERYLITNAARKRDELETSDERFDEIYLGHTPINYLLSDNVFEPQKLTNIWAMDTAASYDGKVTLMDIDTKEIFQSDFVCKYYPDEKGRNRVTYNEHLKAGGDPR